jgi:hypothetical protein
MGDWGGGAGSPPIPPASRKCVTPKPINFSYTLIPVLLSHLQEEIWPNSLAGKLQTC